VGITAIRRQEEHLRHTGGTQVRASDLLDGWRHILTQPVLRALYFNNMLVAGLIMATEPLLAVLLLRQLGFPPWQYGLAFAAPCAGGFIGSRLARRIVARYGQHRVLRAVGTLRAVWLIGLAFVQPGVPGLATVIAVELAIIISMSLYNPVLATYRLERTPQDRIGRNRHVHRPRWTGCRRQQRTHGSHRRGAAHPVQPPAAAPPPSLPTGGWR
jgi:hypothetical protein